MGVIWFNFNQSDASVHSIKPQPLLYSSSEELIQLIGNGIHRKAARGNASRPTTGSMQGMQAIHFLRICGLSGSQGYGFRANESTARIIENILIAEAERTARIQWVY